MSGRKPECEGLHRRIGRQVPEQLAGRVESLWPLITCSALERRTSTSRSQLGVATQLRRPERRCSPGPSRTARPTIWSAWVRRSSLRSAYYLLTSPNWLLENLCSSGKLCLVVGLNGVQEVGSSNLPGPTIFPPARPPFPSAVRTVVHVGLHGCPAVLVFAAYHVLTAAPSLLPALSPVLACTGPIATGVPTALIDPSQRHSSA